MAKNQFKTAKFHNEDEARVWFETARWPNGPVCPHCGSLKHYATKKVGRYRCGTKGCRKDFTVMTGSVMERSHVKLTDWAAAFCLYAASKKGFTAMQLQRHLGVQYNTAWFMHHRIMEAMRRGGFDITPMGGPGSVIEMDETYYGPVDESRRRTTTTLGHPFRRKGTHGPANKRAILALVERGGSVRTFHVPTADVLTVTQIARENIARESTLNTDESKLYIKIGKEYAGHETVHHAAKEYVRYFHKFDANNKLYTETITTNTVEGFFGIFKRGMRGNYQHCAEKHLHRYLAEFEFRYNTRHITDGERAVLAVKSGEGKRLMYHQPR